MGRGEDGTQPVISIRIGERMRGVGGGGGV